MNADTIAIEGISHPTILRYFETLNAGDFAATSELFALNGAMQPPFESPIRGREAIIEYLQREAQGLTTIPREGIAHPADQNCTEFEIAGRAQLPMFGVNVTWYFTLNSDQEVLFTRIKLNASPQELLKLRR